MTIKKKTTKTIIEKNNNKTTISTIKKINHNNNHKKTPKSATAPRRGDVWKHGPQHSHGPLLVHAGPQDQTQKLPRVCDSGTYDAVIIVIGTYIRVKVGFCCYL